MKNCIRLLGIIAMVAVIGFSLVSCIGGGGSGKTINSVDELKEYLNKQPANSPDKPIKITMSANDLMIEDVTSVIKDTDKFVSLTLSGTALTSIPEEAFYECETITDITIPKSVIEIGYYALADCTSLTSVTFEGKIPLNEMYNGNAFGRSNDYYYIGDLCDKYLKGGPGTYTRARDSKTWTKVGNGGDAKAQNGKEEGISYKDFVRDRYPFYLSYLSSTHNLKTFKKRFNEIENDGTVDKEYWSAYLETTQSLKTFKDRLSEIESDGTVDKRYWLAYLSSTHNLKTFKKRLSEIEKDGTGSKLTYLRSTYNLKTFKKRINEIKNESAIVTFWSNAYLRSTHNLKTFKERISELQNDGTIAYWEPYLISKHNLKTFKERLKDIGLEKK